MIKIVGAISRYSLLEGGNIHLVALFEIGKNEVSADLTAGDYQ
jgi:hypothetical protein